MKVAYEGYKYDLQMVAMETEVCVNTDISQFDFGFLG